MPRERDAEGRKPPDYIGQQRMPGVAVHQRHGDQPMHGGRGAPHDDEPMQPPVLDGEAGEPVSGAGVHGAQQHSARRALCISVDDFGLHAGINEAALQLAAMGRAQAIGCMVGGPAWAAGARSLRLLEPGELDLGLHLDLTELPLGPRTAVPLSSIIRDSLLRRLDRPSVRAEIRAQLGAFEQAIGRPPDFVDGHQHVHQLPLVRDELMAELDKRYGWLRPWIRSTRAPHLALEAAPQEWRGTLKPRVIEQLGARALARLARRGGNLQNGHLLGVYDFRGGAPRYRRLLRTWLHAACDGDLLMCHPSLPCDAADALAAARCAEFDVLSGADLEGWLLCERFLLMPMSRILRRTAN